MAVARRLSVALLMLVATQVRAQQPAESREAQFAVQSAELNPRLMTDIHVPLSALIDVLQRRQGIADALAAWEAASQAALPMAPEDEHIAYMLQKSKHTGHEISVAIDLQSRVRAVELNKRFDWKSIEQAGNRIVLTAEPRETVEQLFYRAFELHLNSQTHLPVSIRFIHRNAKQASEPMLLSVKLKLDQPAAVILTSAETSAKEQSDREPRRLNNQSRTANRNLATGVDLPVEDSEAVSAPKPTSED